MDTSILSDYEIFLRTGTSFILTNIIGLSFDPEDGLSLSGAQTIDKLIYIDSSEIICIVKRNEYSSIDRKTKWWNRG